MKSITPTPTPAACCHHRPGNPAAGPEQARVPFGLSVPVSSLQKTKESQERKDGESGGWTHRGRTDRGREGKRPNRGKGGGDRRLVHQIPTMQPQLPGQRLPSPQTAEAPMQKPCRCAEGQRGSGGHRRGAGPVPQLRLMAASVAAAPAPPDVMLPPSSAPWGWSHCSVT